MKKEQSPNPHFEYKFISLDLQLTQEEANRLGQEGWELMCVEPQIKGSEKIMYFKRQTSTTDQNGINSPFREDFIEKFGEERTERIIEFFNKFFDGLKETTHSDHPNCIFFYKEEDGKKFVWMEQDSKNGYMWCRWSGLWSFFINEMNLEYSEIQHVVKTMVEQHLNREVGTPSSRYASRMSWWNNISIER